MPESFRPLLLLALLAAVVALAGCSALALGDVRYADGNYSVAIDNNGPPSGAIVQVTAYRISGWSQEEDGTVFQPVTLVTGHNIITLTAGLGPGRYKLYVYLIRNNSRETAVIRDIGV